MKNIQCFLLLSGLLFNLAAGEKDHWHYPVPAPNGVVNETEQWGGQCSNGRRQSPVDLTHAAAVKGEFSPFIFNNYMEPIKKAAVVNTGHSIQINNPDQSVTVVGGGFPGKYILDQMHFHWASEHTIDGERWALELHMVHHDSKHNSIKEAAAARNGIAVLGVLFHVSSKPNMFLDVILNSAETIKDKVGEFTDIQGKIAPHNLLPVNRTSFFRYEGSLTTPGCGEAVLWTVFTESISISLDQVERFKTIHSDTGHELIINFRSLQPLNSRALVYANGLDYAAGSSNIVINSLLILTLCQILRALL